MSETLPVSSSRAFPQASGSMSISSGQSISPAGPATNPPPEPRTSSLREPHRWSVAQSSGRLGPNASRIAPHALEHPPNAL